MPIDPRMLALSAVIQAVELVDELARFGRCNSAAYETIVKSLFVHSASDAEMIYGSATNLQYGANALLDILSETKANRQNIMMYAIGVMALDKKLRANSEFMTLIDSRLPDIERQISMYGYIHPTIDASISDLYQQTASKLGFRIQVVGDPSWLQQSHVADKVRTLLFGGIRAAALWRHLGGRKWQLLFSKGRIKRELGRMV